MEVWGSNLKRCLRRDRAWQESKEQRVCRQTQKWARPTTEPGTAMWLQWKIPTRGKNSIQQIFMAPTQCKQGQTESPGTALSRHYCMAD